MFSSMTSRCRIVAPYCWAIQSTTPWTISSGADAPAVTPRVATVTRRDSYILTLHEAKEKRQILSTDPLLIEGQNITVEPGSKQKVGVLDAFGDALAGDDVADIILADKIPQIGIGNLGIDGHGKCSGSLAGP